MDAFNRQQFELYRKIVQTELKLGCRDPEVRSHAEELCSAMR